MSKKAKYLFTLALPVAAAAAAWHWGLVTSLITPSGPAYIYDTAEIGRGAIRKLVSTSGPVRALVTVSVGTQLSGQIAVLKVDFNSEVKENEILAELDNKTFLARVAQAKADLATAQALLTNYQAALKKAEVVLAQSERANARQQTLAQKGIAATATLDNANRDMEVARAEILVAKAQIDNAKAQIAQRQAQLDQSQIDLDRTYIRSPINGTVISRTVDIGQTVQASMQTPELFKIAQDLRRIRIEAQVNEADVGSVKEGNGVTFTVDAYPERKFAGKVTQVRLAATELQNVVTYTVIIEADNDDRKLFPGMTANVQIETATRNGALRVPNDALRFRPRGTAAPTAAAGGAGGAGGRASPEERERRWLELAESLKSDLGLDEAQIARVREALTQGGRGGGGQGGGRRGGAQGGAEGGTEGGAGQGPDLAQMRARMQARTEKAVEAVLTEEQRPAFEAWKKSREVARSASVWLLGANGQPISRQIRIGIADDQFAELLGSAVKAGERVIVRGREAKK